MLVMAGCQAGDNDTEVQIVPCPLQRQLSSHERAQEVVARLRNWQNFTDTASTSLLATRLSPRPVWPGAFGGWWTRMYH